MFSRSIDQLDKADAPPIPESYIYLLGVQSTIALCEGLAAYAGPIYTKLVVQRPRAAGDAAIRAPSAFDLTALPADDPQTAQLLIMKDMISEGWPALLAALSFIISTNLSEELFVEVLASYQSVTKKVFAASKRPVLKISKNSAGASPLWNVSDGTSREP